MVIRRALEAAVECIPEDGGAAGVRLRRWGALPTQRHD